MQLLIFLADYKDRWQLEALDSQALMIVSPSLHSDSSF